METTFIHPEVRAEVIKEFCRLRERHPGGDGNSMWEIARDFVWTSCIADSSLLREEIMKKDQHFLD